MTEHYEDDPHPQFKLGVEIPNEGDLPLELGVVVMAQAAESAGADSLWVNDHIVMVDVPGSIYPYTPDGRIPWPMDRKFFDALTTLSFVAAVTHRCTVGTAVLILPQRPVLHLAKAAASIDALSNGRLVLGVGVGWFREEMEALGFDFASRGKRADEMLEVLRNCWTGHPRPFVGQTLTIGEGIVMEPRPPGGPPVLIGGMSPAAYRRAGRYGDGWMGVANSANFEAELPSIQDAVSTLNNIRQASTRDQQFRLVMKLNTPSETWASLPTILKALRELGFDEVTVQPFSDSVAAGVERIEMLRSVV